VQPMAAMEIAKETISDMTKDWPLYGKCQSSRDVDSETLIARDRYVPNAFKHAIYSSSASNSILCTSSTICT
jgi:hypothetical protein